jgi:adenylate kinase
VAPWFALTGTPGTGKSSVAAYLPSDWKPVEVAEIARALGAARPSPFGGTVVDLERMRRRFPAPDGSVQVVVGHLAHLLPIRDVFLLRCHPTELERRLLASRHGSRRERFENVVVEAIDVILVEARARHRRVWEVDTTGRTPRSIAATIVRLVRGHARPRSGRVNWLADPNVTDYLLRQSR